MKAVTASSAEHIFVVVDYHIWSEQVPCYPHEVRGLGNGESAGRTLCLYKPWSLGCHTNNDASEDQ